MQLEAIRDLQAAMREQQKQLSALDKAQAVASVKLATLSGIGGAVGATILGIVQKLLLG
jgi:hypothetical protein